ncbi:chromosome partitioning protein, ParB family [Actinobaculum suis]|uniref:Chromosome partitioning protein, ParB family n=1 Tax=Actinobaculum suis TaxID=1657 RepID=A0A1G7A435_9ACTO|nr:ParB/RepB/Spo0J family partition protein [Actinobaculum suis]MDY5152698.1 ParB/RepB/Spo0J family partition protein [Actinobaculum suis]SDE09654.1 chromosome partitioning protein, ParB family [Actinobaculum suis]
MAKQKRRGLGAGLGALIPESQKEATNSPIDVFFGGTPHAPKAVDKGEAQTKQAPGEGNVSRETLPPSKEVVGTASLRDDSPTARTETESTTPKTSSENKASARKAAPKGPKLSAKATTKVANEAPVETQDAIKQKTRVSAKPKKQTPVEEAKLDVEETTLPEEVSSNQVADKGATGPVTTDREPGLGVDKDVDSDDLVPVPGATFAEIPLEQIVANRAQPRQYFDEEELEELADSISQVGVLQPIVVRPLTEPLEDNPAARYELIMGERRWRASQKAGLDSIPAIVRRTQEDDLLRDALLENLHRVQLNPLEEAAAYQQLIEDFGWTQEELSRKISKSRPVITNTLRLLRLPALVQKRVAAGVLSAGHARALLGLADPADMEILAQRIVAENLSVRQVEEIVAMGIDKQEKKPRTRRRAGRYQAELNTLAGHLSDRFETKVKVRFGQNKGSMTIDFADIDDLNRILEVLAPGEASLIVEEPESES